MAEGAQARARCGVLREDPGRERHHVQARLVGLVVAPADEAAQGFPFADVDGRRCPRDLVEQGQAGGRGKDHECPQGEPAPGPAWGKEQQGCQTDAGHEEGAARGRQVQDHEQEACAHAVQQAPVAPSVARGHAQRQQGAQPQKGAKGVVILPQAPQLAVHHEMVRQVA